MPESPPIANVGLGARVAEGIGISLAANKIDRMLNSSGRGFFIHLGEAFNAPINWRFLSHFDRASNYAQAALDYDAEQTLPPSEEIGVRLRDFFRTIVVADDSHTEAAVAADPGNEAAIRRGIEAMRTNGSQLFQQIVNLANGDKTSGRELSELVGELLESTRETTVATVPPVVDGLVETAGNFIEGVVDFFVEGRFARPRRSGDGKRVSKEIHEYNYLQSPVLTYTHNLNLETTSPRSHIQFALDILRSRFVLSQNGQVGGFTSSVDTASIEGLEDWLVVDVDISAFDASKFSYGNFVDCYNFRQLLADLKKLVQSVRGANVKSILQLMDETTQGEFIVRIVNEWSASQLVLAASEIALIHLSNPTNLRNEVQTGQYLQPITAATV